MSWNCQFDIPGEINLRALIRNLQELVPCSVESENSLSRTFYDTYDWRLYASGRVMEELRINKNTATTYLRPLNRTTAQACATTTGQPIRFLCDLPQHDMRDRLAPIIEMRALLPVARMRCRVTSLRLLDKIEKTVAYLDLEENRLASASGRHRGDIIRRASVVPVKGYVADARRLARLLSENMGLERAGSDMLITALAAIGRKPGDYSSKVDVQLDPHAHADVAGKVVLRRLLEIMQANENGIRQNIDSEFLHDFRVAVRRTRSALGQFKRVFPERAVNRYLRDFQWLQQDTGPARDMDVYLLNFATYQSLVEPSLRPALAPLQKFLRQNRDTQYRRLTRALDSVRYNKLITDWQAFLDKPSPGTSTLKNATRPVVDVASERIWRLFRRAIKTGGAISDDSPAQELHELRKTCKKLRYMVEFSQSMYPQGDIKKLVAALKQLQNNLGDFNDYQVQSDVLQQFSEKIHARGTDGPQTLMAIGNLVAALRHKRESAREAFYSHYRKFARPRVAARFQRLFRHAANGSRDDNMQ